LAAEDLLIVKIAALCDSICFDVNDRMPAFDEG